MRILHISQSDTVGGAAIAALRLVLAQRAAGLDARMLVVAKSGSCDFVGEAGNAGFRARAHLARMLAWRIARLGATIDPEGMRSLGLIPSGLKRAIVANDPHILHWHWIGKEAVSLGEMASINIPAAWTCHDQWAFCGAEHYASDGRFMDGYQSSRLLDVDAIIFRRKRRAWADWHPTLICPSEWMAQQARSSALMGGEEIVTIPNTIDTATFAVRSQIAARQRFGLPLEARIVLFGTDSGVADPRKGFDMLASALERIPVGRKSEILLATFGGSAPGESEMAGFRHVEFGRQSEPEDLATLYSAANVFVAPSRVDNLPNTMVEAQACGLPCVAFAIGGMSDIISRPAHGVVVPPFDIAGLAAAIQDVALRNADRDTIQRDAETRFGSKSVVAMHNSLYRRLLTTWEMG